MNLKHTASVILLASLPLGAHGQTPLTPAAHHGLTQPHASPLLYVRVGGLPGMRVTVFPGGAEGRTLPTPETMGLRPGYIYRLELRDLPGLPGVSLYPTLEVRGTLVLPSNMRASDYPAPVLFSPEDIQQILSGALLTKVIYLEPPDHAFAVATQPGVPIETDLRPGQDILAQARALGRLALIVRLGTRAVTPQELIQQAVAGTMLLPGDKALGKPVAPPYLPYGCFSAYDPTAGPPFPEEECLHDGGDVGLTAGLDRAGQLHGLDPSDTVAVYQDSKGNKHVAVSNRICICVPRFGVVRMLTLPTGYGTSVALVGTNTVVTQGQMQARLPTVQTKQTVLLDSMASRARASAIQNTEGLVEVETVQGIARLVARLREQEVVGALVQKTPAPPDRPLLLCKSADKQAAHIGDVVTFTLKYTNQGGQPINDVVVSDSLTTRLEYIVGSAKTDREAIFTMQENGAGSLILRWEVRGPLLPGHSGVVTFQARIR